MKSFKDFIIESDEITFKKGDIYIMDRNATGSYSPVNPNSNNGYVTHYVKVIDRTNEEVTIQQVADKTGKKLLQNPSPIKCEIVHSNNYNSEYIVIPISKYNKSYSSAYKSSQISSKIVKQFIVFASNKA